MARDLSSGQEEGQTQAGNVKMDKETRSGYMMNDIDISGMQDNGIAGFHRRTSW